MRYLFFITWYHQWFKNHEGIKGFAHQCMNWLMRSTLNLAAKLKKENRQLAEKIKELSTELNTNLLHPTIDADEYAALKGKIRTYAVILWICVIGEAFFNFFAAKALFDFDGWLAISAQTIFAILITWLAIALFENLFQNLLYEKPYKGEHKEPRHWGRLIVLIIMAIGYEGFTYYICKVRGIQVEGGEGTGVVATAMMIAGMLIPVIAGYYSYEKRRYIAPYKNTLRIEKLRKLIATKENKIAKNLQKWKLTSSKIARNTGLTYKSLKHTKKTITSRTTYPKKYSKSITLKAKRASSKKQLPGIKTKHLKTTSKE